MKTFKKPDNPDDNLEKHVEISGKSRYNKDIFGIGNVIMDKNEIREILKAFKKDYDGINADEAFFLTKEAIKYIGDTDPSLRDGLVLPFIEHTVKNDLLSPKEIKYISEIVLVNIALKGRRFDDGVFTRTFSMLVMAIIIDYHRRHPTFDADEIHGVFIKVLDSYKNDFDVRGYISKKGWAHGAAHGADALLQLALLKEATPNMLLQILGAIHKKITISYYGYIHNEDDRMAKVAVAIIKKKGLPTAKILNWLQNFRIKKLNSYSYIIRLHNIRSFLSCVYFRLVGDDAYVLVTNEIKEIISMNC